MANSRRSATTNDNLPALQGGAARQAGGATLGLESTLWRAADKLRSNLDAAEYEHVVLGLITGGSHAG